MKIHVKSKGPRFAYCIDKSEILTKYWFFLCLCMLVLIRSSYAGAKYSIVDLGPSRHMVSAWGINDTGEVAGTLWTGSRYRAYLYVGGAMINLGTPGNGSSGAHAVNNDGQVAGWGPNTTDGYTHAYLWNDVNIMQDLGSLGGNESSAYGINNSGDVVGWSHPSSGPYHAFLYRNGVMQDLGTLGGTSSVARGINDSGQVVGWSLTASSDYRAFIWENGVMQDLGTLGGEDSFGYAINSLGEVVGHSTYEPGGFYSHAFLYQDGVMQALGSLGGRDSRAYAINGSGDVVGKSVASDGWYHAFLYSGGVMTDLNELISPDSGWILGCAHAINNHRQITGDGVNPAGESHSFLLTPIPWPSPQFYAVVCGKDERGQRFGADAEAIHAVLLEYPGVRSDNLRLVSNPSDLETTIAEVIEKLQPGDQFWFYYSGHGSYGYDGTEPAVWNSPLVALYTNDLQNEGDEYLVFGPYVSDDLLTTWLSSHPKMRGVRKVVILDSCMSGGFWGREGNESDEGDLDKLQNIGLIAACSERNFAYSYPDWSWLGERRGRGMFSFVLEEQLRRGDDGIAPADLNQDGEVSFEELSTAVERAYTIEQGDIGVIRTFPWLEEDIEVEINSPNDIPELYINHTADFDPNAPIIVKETIADLDNDGDVDFGDLTVLASHWLEIDCKGSGWCEGTDLDRSGVVNFADFAIIAEDWLNSKILGDLDLDHDVDLADFAIFASRWYHVNCSEFDWCHGADVDRSGQVRILDLEILCRNWLEGASP